MSTSWSNSSRTFLEFHQSISRIKRSKGQEMFKNVLRALKNPKIIIKESPSSVRQEEDGRMGDGVLKMVEASGSIRKNPERCTKLDGWNEKRRRTSRDADEMKRCKRVGLSINRPWSIKTIYLLLWSGFPTMVFCFCVWNWAPIMTDAHLFFPLDSPSICGRAYNK